MVCGSADADFRGETRSHETHALMTNPGLRLFRRGPGMEAKPAFLGQALMENRSGLLVDACVTLVSDLSGRPRHWSEWFEPWKL